MTLTAKETSLLKDLRSQEQLCIEKYAKGAAEAHDSQLKNLFTQLGQTETQHLQTLDQISSGTVPQMNAGSGGKSYPAIQPSTCTEEQKKTDAFLCSDALAMEKHVSASYDTCIFEFVDPNVRNVLNHIQKEEQQHGERIYNYMAVNGMYG
jgi:spore coat protein CotF